MINRKVIFGLGVAVAAFMTACGPPRAEIPAARITAAVIKIVDGDTFYLQGLPDRVRVWGIDAPELDEEGGRASTGYLATLIGSRPLTCHLRGKDRYGRHVALCNLPDGRDIAAEMIRAGHAVEFVRYPKNPPEIIPSDWELPNRQKVL